MDDADTIERDESTELGLPAKPDDTSLLPVVLSTIKAGRGLLPAPIEQLQEVANFMSAAGPMIPPAFQGHPDRCLAVAYQAARWGMDPIAVCGKAYVTKSKPKGETAEVERIAYEAQLVMAVINTRAPIKGRLSFAFHGSGPDRFCVVTGIIRGDREPKIVQSPPFKRIKVKNSPLWFSDPDQQFSYYTARAWARRHCPEVLLGIYTPDELVHMEVIGVETAQRLLSDPYSDDDVIVDAEFTPVPSGGADWHLNNAPPQQGDGDHPNAPPRDQRRSAKSPTDGMPDGPDDLPALREWLAAEQRRILALTEADTVFAEADKLVKDDRWDRIKAYDQPTTTAVKSSLASRVRELRAKADKPK